MNEEIEQLENRVENLEDTVRSLRNRIGDLEQELEDLSSYYVLAKAVCELQDELRKLHPELYLTNEVYAPTKVGMK